MVSSKLNASFDSSPLKYRDIMKQFTLIPVAKCVEAHIQQFDLDRLFEVDYAQRVLDSYEVRRCFHQEDPEWMTAIIPLLLRHYATMAPVYAYSVDALVHKLFTLLANDKYLLSFRQRMCHGGHATSCVRHTIKIMFSKDRRLIDLYESDKYH